MKQKYLAQILGFIFLTLLGTSYRVAAETTNEGTITFIYDLNEGQCTMPVRDKQQLAIFHAGEYPEYPCKGHSVRFIQFNNVRSAVSVWLGSQFDQWNHAVGCNGLDNPATRPNNFLFELRTVKNMPSNEPIALDHITGNNVGNPIIPGVVVKSRWVNKADEINRELSCVRINFD